MGRDTDWAALYGDHPEHDSGGRSRPPIWVMVVVVAAVVIGGWLLVTQGSTDGDAVAGTTIPFEPDLTTTTTVSVATTLTLAPVDVSGLQPAAVTAESPQQLRGYVAVTSPDASTSQDTVWMFRPGGSVVSRGDNSIRTDNAEYPMLITAGHLIVGNQIFDIDLAEPPISLWTDETVYPGSGPGVVWLAPHVGFSPVDWVAQVDVESLTVSEQVDLTDFGILPYVGAADGLIVANFNDESAAFWSPTDGLAGVFLTDERRAVFAASGDVVFVADSEGVNVLDIVSGGFVSSFELPAIGGSVTSVCLSPNGQHVIVVGSSGAAVVGNITTGEVIVGLNAVNNEFPIQREHGIGWTTNNQLVFIGEPEGDAKHIFGIDIAPGERSKRFVVAQLDGAEDWWLAASGTMC